MGNLGAYQIMTSLAKKVHGPLNLALYWDGCWECPNCDCTIDTSEDDYDAILD